MNASEGEYRFYILFPRVFDMKGEVEDFLILG